MKITVALFSSFFFVDRMTIEIVNKYWPIFLNESMPLAQETIEPILLERANKVSLRVPFHNVLA